MARKNKVNGDSPVTLEILTQFYKDHLKPEFEKIGQRFDKVDLRFTELDKRIDELDAKIDSVDVKVDKLDDQFDGLKAELSDTVSRRDFDKFKAKMAS